MHLRFYVKGRVGGTEARNSFVQAIIAGSGIPFVMYAIWELVILGTIEPGVKLSSAAQIIDGLSEATGGKATLSVKVFSFFAIVTSFLGVGLGCIDFLKVTQPWHLIVHLQRIHPVSSARYHSFISIFPVQQYLSTRSYFC